MLYTFGSNIKVPEDLILVKEEERMEYMRYSEKAEKIMEDIRKCKNKEEKRILNYRLLNSFMYLSRSHSFSIYFCNPEESPGPTTT